MLVVLRGAGFDEQAAGRACEAIHKRANGFAVLRAPRDQWASIAETTDETVDQLAALTTPRQFAAGLAHLLAGIQRIATF